MQVVVGIDIGGTKCAVSFARQHSDDIIFLDKVRMETETEDFDRAMESFIEIIRERFRRNPDWKLTSIGISCGGPLDAGKGLILSPPNLPRSGKRLQEYDIPYLRDRYGSGADSK